MLEIQLPALLKLERLDLILGLWSCLSWQDLFFFSFFFFFLCVSAGNLKPAFLTMIPPSFGEGNSGRLRDYSSSNGKSSFAFGGTAGIRVS